jgi:hypothetical protein
MYSMSDIKMNGKDIKKLKQIVDLSKNGNGVYVH